MDAPTVGVLAHFEFEPGNEAFAAQFFAAGRLVVEGQPATTMWFAYRLGPGEYGAFATFASVADRDALLAAGGPRLAEENRDRFARAPSFQKLDILTARYAGPATPTR
jgi:hypothetical protein